MTDKLEHFEIQKSLQLLTVPYETFFLSTVIFNFVFMLLSKASGG